MRATPLLPSLLALTLLASCQARPFGAPTGARFQLAADEAAIAPTIPIAPAGSPAADTPALTVDLASFLATFSGYRRVLAVIADVENIVVTVTADDGTVHTQTLTKAQIAAGQTVLQFPGVKPGKATIAAEAFNSTGGSLGKAVQTAAITAGAMPAVLMNIPLGQGGSSGGGSSGGSSAPSPSPTPTNGDLSAAVTVHDSRTVVNLDTFKLTSFGGPDISGFAVDASGVAWAVSGKTTRMTFPGFTGWAQELIKFPVGDVWGTNVAPADDPYDMVLEPSGAIWYTSLAHKKVTRVSQTGTVLATAQVSAVPPVRGLALDGAGNVWVANGQAVSKLTPTGTIVGTYALGGPAGALTVDVAGGFVWVTIGNRLTKVALDGTVLATSAPFTQGPSNDSAGLAVDAQGDVWLADVVDAQLIKFGSDAVIHARIEVGSPIRDVAIDQNGLIWAVGGTTGRGCAYKLAPDGHIMTEYNLTMNACDTVKVDPNNQVWVRATPTGYSGGVFRISP